MVCRAGMIANIFTHYLYRYLNAGPKASVGVFAKLSRRGVLLGVGFEVISWIILRSRIANTLGQFFAKFILDPRDQIVKPFKTFSTALHEQSKWQA